MANIFTNFLDSVSGDLKNTNLKDYRHANKLFVQNFYRLAPKHGFLYFVKFRLNPNVAQTDAWKNNRLDLELGMLVKSCDLPKISFEGQTLNIYNKKQPVYTKILYNPLNMVLHDDNRGLVREFWQMYYQYYSSDSYYAGSNATPGILPVNPVNRYEKPAPVSQQQLNARATPNGSYVDTTDPARYGLDTTMKEQLIRSIEIYQLSRKDFFLHTLINPKIRSWNMDTLASDSKNLLTHNVTFEYEGVYFGSGKVTRFTPDGWTDLHYDLDPSPIGGIFGKTQNGLYGPGGLIQDGTTLYADITDAQQNQNLDQRQALALLFRSARLISNASNLDVDLARKQVEETFINSVTITNQSSTSNGAVQGLNVNRPNDGSNNTEAVSRQVSPEFNPNNSAINTNTAGTPDGSNTVPVSRA
jgi:hypothetical protein